MRRKVVLTAAGSVAIMALAGAWILVPSARSAAGGASDVGAGEAGAAHASDGPARLWQHGVASERPTPPLIPVEGVYSDLLEDNFGIPRAGDRRHRGIDIPAPLGTPVLAVTDGWVVSMREGGAGGRALFLLDRSGRYLFYYAHLDQYADLLWTGRPVRRGERLGYVGTTGNADGRTPHLHFEVGRVADPARWWAFEQVNPYDFLVAGGSYAR